MSTPHPQASPPLLPVTAEQQKVLDRIAVQRERLKARRAAQRQALAVQAQQQGTDLDATLVMRVLAFARMHPVAVGVAAVVAMAAGPQRLVRWAGLLMPLVARMRR